jgi:hypothetical protein
VKIFPGFSFSEQAAMASEGGIHIPVEAAATPQTYPPFGGSGGAVLTQLNDWAATVSTMIGELGVGLAAANGRALLLQQEVEARDLEMVDNLRQVTTLGANALTTTIDAFRVELGKHEHAHNLARTQIEAVVFGAERKFQETQDLASRDALALYDSFSIECARRAGEDVALRVELQSKFAEVERMLAQTAVHQQAPATATGAASSGGNPWGGQDPWSQGRVGTAAGGGPGAAAASGPQGGAPDGSGGNPNGGTLPGATSMGGAAVPRALSIINRDWGDNKRLDLVTQPEAFVTWRDRALGHLAKGRPDIRRLLTWAERQTTPIDQVAEDTGAKNAGVMENAEDVCYALFEGIKHIIHDNLLGRARICGAGRGLELWRKLHSEWQGAAPQVIAAKSKKFQDPLKCSNVLQLWEALPAWEQLGAEIAAGGYPLPDWLMANSLEKLLPDEMLKTIVGRMELADYAPKMAWVRAQMEYAKSNARANHIAPAPRAKKEQEDVDMGNLVGDLPGCDDSMLANLQAECGRRAAVGDWQGMEHIANAICALSKGKGKGKGGFKGKGKGFAGGGWQAPYSAQPDGGTKGGQKGGKAGGKGGKGGAFEGTCHHCGKFGHRKNECRALDAEMAQHRGINNVDENGNVVEEEREGAQEGSAPSGEDDVWWMGATYSLTPEPCRQPSRGTVKISHRFDALQEETAVETSQRAGVDDPTPCESRARTAAGTTFRAPSSSEPKFPTSSTLPGKERRQRNVRRKYVRFPASVALLQADRADDEGDDDDMELFALGVKTPGAVLVEAVVDSGAADPVAKAGTFSGKIVPSTMSKAGRKYRGPDGTRIPNEGQQEVQFTSDEGHRCGMTWQIADVERPLIAVSHLSAAGNKVIFTKGGGEIVNIASGRKIKIQRKGGVYVLRMWVPGPTTPSRATPPFARLAASS